jgi:hypothetical protein
MTRRILVVTVPQVLPDYAGRCITGVLGSLGVGLSTPGPRIDDLSAAVRGADGVVLVVLDGLGDDQLAERAHLAPVLAAARLAPLTSVAPSTTAAALTSLSTGVAPGRHGIVGYRFAMGDDVLQALRWTVDDREAAAAHPPDRVQRVAPTLRLKGAAVPYVGKTSFSTSSFTKAHLRGSAYVGVAGPEEMPGAVVASLGESALVLCYHDAIDKVAHAKGLEGDYDAALVAADLLVAEIRAAIPAGVAVVVTSDHGQVDVGPAAVDLTASTDALVARRSGEGRFRWLHAHPGEAGSLFDRASTELESSCWVMSRRQVVASELLGEVDDEVVDRLGDVALIPFVDAFVPDPSVPREHQMRSRHGSLTSAEMRVPLCVIA